MKKLILSLLVSLAAVPCFAQTTSSTTSTPTTPPAGDGQGLEQRLQQMTPEQRQVFLDNHPGIARREEMLARMRGMTPEQQQQFLQNHPKLQEFVNNHPQVAARLATASEAGAGVKDPGHPRVNEVNQREQNQQNRIAQGVKNDSLTPQQTSNLEKGENHIQHQETADLEKNNGHLTKAEQRRLNGEENRESGRIYKDKHE